MKSRNVILMMSLAAILALPVSAQLRGSTLGEMWRGAADAARMGEIERANSIMEEIQAAQQTLGIERLPSFATSAASLSIDATSEGNEELADWAIAAAERLDPENPSVEAAHADLLYQRGGLGAAFGAFPGAVAEILNRHRTSLVARSDLLISIAVAIVLLALGLSLIMLFKYYLLLLHDAREFLSEKLGPGTSTVLAFAFLLAPLLLWLSPIWLIPWWLLLVVRYASVRERIVITLSLALLALTPLIAARAAHGIASSQRAVVQAVEASKTNSYDPEVSRRIKELLLTLPDNPPLHLLAGNLALIEGDDTEALRHYQQAAELDDRYAGAHLNIGNIHFLQQDQAAAIFRYERASELDPGLIEAYINNSIVAGETFDFPRQTELIDRAKEVDKSRADELLDIENPSRQVHFYQPSGEEVDAIAEASTEEGSPARELFGNYAAMESGSALMHPLTIGALVALLLTIALSSRRGRTASACVKCGRTFCHRCKSSKASSTYCTQCIHIYIKRDGVLVNAKQKKMDEIARYQKSVASRTKWLSLLMPGASQIMRNRVEIGWIVLFLFMLGITVAFFSGRLAPIVSPAEALQSILRILAIGLAMVLWIVFTLPTIFRRVRRG